jgi:glycosyltransferase involved in cell wall biosynthesis
LTPPHVSLCIPTYNRARFLSETIASALGQTVRDLEVVVVDDNSPDDTGAVVQRCSDPRVRYVRNETNLGVPENLNRAFALGRGEFLVLLEDHDLLDERYLERTLDVLHRHPRVAFVATGLVTIDEEGQPIRNWVMPLPEVMEGRALLRRLLTRTTCPFSVTTVVRRSALAGLERPFDPQYWWYADQNLWMKLCTRGGFGYVPQPLLKLRTREMDHTLSGKEWESLLAVDRVNRDNRPLLYPRRTLRSTLDGWLYEVAKTQRAVRYRLAKSWRRDVWSAEDRRNTALYLGPFGRLAVALAGAVPTGVLQASRHLYRRYASAR